MATIQEVYIALFGRPADPIGYNYYVEATDDGANLDAVGDLSNSPEYQARFEGMSEIDMINQIYQDLFGRPADAEGLLFYVAQLQSGAASAQDIAIRILDGATGDDAEIIANKVEAAQLFTDSLDTAEEISAYQGAEAADFGRAYLDGVTADDATVPTQEEVDTVLVDLVDDVNEGVPGDTFTLTSDLDQFVGTADNDTFQGAAASIGAFDSIDGEAGTDTLNIVGDLAGADFTGVSIESIETVNVSGNATAVDSSTFGSAVQQVWQIGDAGSVTVGSGVTAGFRNTVVSDSVIAAAGVTSVNVALDNVDAAGVVTFEGEDLTTVTVSGSVEQDADASIVEALDLHDHTANAAGTESELIETLNLSLTTGTAVDLNGEFDSVVTLNAAGSTAGLAIDVSSLVALETATFGAAADDVSAAISDDADTTFDLGAGNDVFTLDGSGDTENSLTTVTLGAGNDTFAVDTALTNISDVSAVEEGLIVVTDFNVDEDVLDLSALGTRDTLSAVELGNIAGAADLEAALDLAVAATTEGQYSIFNFGGNAYVLNNLDVAADVGVTNALEDGDGLIQLTGVAAAELTEGFNLFG
jgi:hypothetical protein